MHEITAAGWPAARGRASPPPRCCSPPAVPADDRPGDGEGGGGGASDVGVTDDSITSAATSR